jgi:hypothetical protein
MRPQVEHGTPTKYKNHGCRCEPCKAAWRAHNNAYNARRRATGRPEGISLEAAPAFLGVPPTSSWWLGVPREGLTARVEREHLVRMRSAPAGTKS